MKNKREITGEELIKNAQRIDIWPYEKAKEIKSFGRWTVKINGDMEFGNMRYFIGSNRLAEKDWIIHLAGKNWIIWNDFIPAYFQALLNAGIREITIDTCF